MRSTQFVAAALGAALAALPMTAARAQQPTATGAPDSTASGPVLTLEEAIALALKNNPDHLATIDARRTAAAQKRSALAAFLPNADVSIGGTYRQSGAQPIQGVNASEFAVQSDVYQSYYSLDLSLRLNAATFMNPSLYSATVRAADADIAGSREATRAKVTTDYLTVLQNQAAAALQDSLVAQNEVQLELARAKLAAGSGTQLDVTSAEVALGQAKVAALQAHNQVEVAKLTLFQDMGVRQPANVQLTTRFEVHPPTFTLDSVLALAREHNPTMQALRARDHVAAVGVRIAKAQYLPSLGLNAGWGGYTYQYANDDYPVQQALQQVEGNRESCFMFDSLRVGAGMPSIAGQCNAIQLTPATIDQIRAQNNQFPFDFSRQPFQISAQLSLPIFNGLQREQQIEEAEAQRNTARYNIRKQELALTQAVTSAYLTLVTDAKAVELQEQNAVAARQQLALAQERYRVGAADYLELTNARATYEQAENARINAIFKFHISFANLESAVGRPLR